MSKPKILLLVQLPPPVHGVSVINQKIVESRLLTASFEMNVIPIRFSETIDDIDKFSAGKLFKTISIFFRLLRSCIFNRPDLVYFTLSPIGKAFYRDILYVALFKLLGLKRVFHLHRIGILKEGKIWYKRILYKWVFSGAMVIHLSPSLYEDIADYVQRKDCSYVSNGIEDPLADPEEPSSGEKGEQVNIAFLSHMVPGKGPVILLNSLVELMKRGLNFRATFAGGRVSDEWNEAFDKLVKNTPLEERISYIGEVHGMGKDRFFREAGIFVFPTVYDSFGIVILEAMAYSLPVIASNQGSIPDIVMDGETGMIFSKGDVSELARKLEILIKDDALRAVMGHSGRRRFKENYTLDAFEKSLENVLREFVSDSRT